MKKSRTVKSLFLVILFIAGLGQMAHANSGKQFQIKGSLGTTSQTSTRDMPAEPILTFMDEAASTITTLFLWDFGTVTITILVDDDNYPLQVYQTMVAADINTQHVINISGLASGDYIIKYENEGGEAYATFTIR